MVLLYVGSTDSPAIGAMAQHNLCPLCCLPEVTEQHCWHRVWAPNPQDQQEAQISTLWGISTHIKQKGFFVCAYGIRQENFLSDGKWQFNFKRIKTRVLKQVSWQKMVLFRGTLPSDHWIVDKHEVFVQGLSLCCAESAFLPAKHLDSVTTLFFLSFLHAPHSLPSNNCGPSTNLQVGQDAQNAARRKRLPALCCSSRSQGKPSDGPVGHKRHCSPLWHWASRAMSLPSWWAPRTACPVPTMARLASCSATALKSMQEPNQTSCSEDLHKGIIKCLNTVISGTGLWTSLLNPTQ